ncbi:MAG: hypothetical protein JXA21_12845 [Anaerolineae bacterium]|nr:hypothetical protein [Anaerolineae bacterium]
MSETGKNSPRSFTQSSLFLIFVIFAVSCLTLILLLAPAAAIAAFELNPLWMIPPSFLVMLLMIGAALILVARVLALPTQEMDAVMTPLGLAPKPYMMGTRYYQGSISERQVDILTNRIPNLEIHVSTSLKTRLYATTKKWDTWKMGTELDTSALALEDSRLADMVVRVWDEPWARAALAYTDVLEPLHRLLGMEDARLRHIVSLNSGKLSFWLSAPGRYYMPMVAVAPDVIRRCLEDVLALAEALERAPEPQGVIHETLRDKMYPKRSPSPRMLMITLLLTFLFTCCYVSLIVLFVVFWDTF